MKGQACEWLAFTGIIRSTCNNAEALDSRVPAAGSFIHYLVAVDHWLVVL